jgi:hypothetical protein
VLIEQDDGTTRTIQLPDGFQAKYLRKHLRNLSASRESLLKHANQKAMSQSQSNDRPYDPIPLPIGPTLVAEARLDPVPMHESEMVDQDWAGEDMWGMGLSEGAFQSFPHWNPPSL